MMLCTKFHKKIHKKFKMAAAILNFKNINFLSRYSDGKPPDGGVECKGV